MQRVEAPQQLCDSCTGAGVEEGGCFPPQHAHKLARKLQQIVGQAGLCTSKGRGMFSSTQSQQRRRGRRQRRRRRAAGQVGVVEHTMYQARSVPLSFLPSLHPTQLAPGYKVNKIPATQGEEEGRGGNRTR